MNFNVYQHISHFNVHGRHPLNEKKQCQLGDAPTYSIVNAKTITRKELLIMETSIVYFDQQLYMPAKKKLALNLPHRHILGTHHCGNKF